MFVYLFIFKFLSVRTNFDKSTKTVFISEFSSSTLKEIIVFLYPLLAKVCEISFDRLLSLSWFLKSIKLESMFI